MNTSREWEFAPFRRRQRNNLELFPSPQLYLGCFPQRSTATLRHVAVPNRSILSLRGGGNFIIPSRPAT
jgi:hypothetical protein